MVTYNARNEQHKYPEG